MNEDNKLHLGDHQFALRFREWVRRTIRTEMRKMHPPDAYGVVSTVDYSARRAGILFGNSTSPVSRPFSYSAQPVAGQTVRVCGRASNRYIAAVITAPVWNELTLVNSWAAGTQDPQASRDTNGIVHLRGSITGGT